MNDIIYGDHYPEVVECGKGQHRLELLGLSEQFSDPNQRRELFANMTDVEFQKMCGYINSTTRNQKISYDYEDGNLLTMTTPGPDAKEPLMNKAFETVRDILSNPTFSNEVALRRAGLTIAGALNYIHPYNDGNGRTGRVLHYLLEFGSERANQAFDEELYAIIGGVAVYDSDTQFAAIFDMPPWELDLGLARAIREEFTDKKVETMDPRDHARIRAEMFLDMMRGSKTILVVEKINLSRDDPDFGKEVDGVELYEGWYLENSIVPNRLPTEVPVGSKRIRASDAW